MNEFEVPNLEDPVSDGQFKKVFKNALFPPVFDSMLVVFKVAANQEDDRLILHTRSVQMAALCIAASVEFNSLCRKNTICHSANV